MRANGYTIVWKDLLTKPEFWRLAKRVREHAGAPLSDADAESRALGYLTKLWLLADSHIADDDTLDMGPDEVDKFLGVAGLSQVLGPNWLEILDADQVRLPNWLAHNGVQAKKQARAFARKQRYDAKQQERKSVLTGTQERSTGNGTELPPIPSHPIPSLPIPAQPSPKERRAARARTRRAPADFKVTEAMREWAREEAPETDVDRETALFRDHEFRDPHSDWLACWRKWMRRAPEFRSRRRKDLPWGDGIPPKSVEQLEAEEAARAKS